VPLLFFISAQGQHGFIRFSRLADSFMQAAATLIIAQAVVTIIRNATLCDLDFVFIVCDLCFVVLFSETACPSGPAKMEKRAKAKPADLKK